MTLYGSGSSKMITKSTIERGKRLGAFGLRVDGALLALDAAHRRIAVHRHDQEVAESARWRDSGMAGMDQVKTAVRENDLLPRCTEDGEKGRSSSMVLIFVCMSNYTLNGQEGKKPGPRQDGRPSPPVNPCCFS